MAPTEYLGRAGVAALLDVKTDSINGYDLPEPDVMVDKHRGWKKDTILRWRDSRPGRGNWGGRVPGA